MKKYQYRATHTAIAAVYGKPNKCESCHGKNKSKRFEWSNKDHKYTLHRSKWWMLCATCHRRYDRKKFGWNTWNKGRKGLQKNHNFSGLLGGGWNKGKRTPKHIREKLSKAHLGKTPWNKGVRYKQKKNRHLIEKGIVKP